MLSPNKFSQAFRKNCPNVRMIDYEEFELNRLFLVAMEAAVNQYRLELEEWKIKETE